MAGLLLFIFAFVIDSQATYDPHRFKDFLLQNRMKQCLAHADQPRLPLSYYVPPTYYDGIPKDQRIPPGGGFTVPQNVPACNHQIIQPGPMNDYMFETERFITTIGLNIYDGATWSIALSLLGEVDEARKYQQGVVDGGATCQFQDVKGDKMCKGVIVEGNCQDPDQTGLCGFCYGDTGSETKPNAWMFRSISDYWSLDGTVDARCPELKHTWVWNDYKPVLGENSWSSLIGPLQVAYLKYGSVEAIPVDDFALKIAINFLLSLDLMKVPGGFGSIFYSPKNTLSNPKTDLGFTVSVENNVSLLGGLKALLHILLTNNFYPNLVGSIKGHIADAENFIKMSYSPSLGYFRQGGAIVNGKFVWSDTFAVDCQTWTMTQIGPVKIDSWFGKGTSVGVWNTTKKIGGYHYHVFDQSVEGLGFSNNSEAQAFSGEWTAGAVNMLRVISKALNKPTLKAEGDEIRKQIEYDLTEDATINKVTCRAVKYTNKRYYIPFGWWANPIDCIASTAWSVFLDSNYNPLHLGGAYQSDY